MDQQFWTFGFVGLTFAIYIGIAIWARAGSTGEFYVAGHDVHPTINGMATAADWMSAASFLSMDGLIDGTTVSIRYSPVVKHRCKISFWLVATTKRSIGSPMRFAM